MIQDAAENDVPDMADSAPASGVRGGRRLSDKILVAFHHACDAKDLVVAEQLLRTVEKLLQRQTGSEQNRRKSVESLVAAHERLWHLRHQE